MRVRGEARRSVPPCDVRRARGSLTCARAGLAVRDVRRAYLELGARAEHLAVLRRTRAGSQGADSRAVRALADLLNQPVADAVLALLAVPDLARQAGALAVLRDELALRARGCTGAGRAPGGAGDVLCSGAGVMCTRRLLCG